MDSDTATTLSIPPIPCKTCKKSFVTYRAVKNCPSCREKNRKKSREAAERKHQRDLMRVKALQQFLPASLTDSDDDDTPDAPSGPLDLLRAHKALEAKKKAKPLSELEGEEKRVVLKQIKNHVDAAVRARGAAVPTEHPYDGKPYQTATSLYETLKRRKDSYKATQKRLKFHGFHAIVANETINNTKRVEMVANDLRKIVRLPFDRTKEAKSYNAETRARVSTFPCTCLNEGKAKPMMNGNSGDLIKMARLSSEAATPRVCGGKIIVTAVADKTHPFHLPGQRIIVRVEH